MLETRLDFSAANCSVARTLAVVGERWTLLVLREAFYGLRRFDELLQAIGCARTVLGDRLATLVEHGLLRREPYREEGQRERFEYCLTPKGSDLFPALVALMKWGDRWLADSAGPAVSVVHRDCGAEVEVVLRCASGHAVSGASAARTLPGPGALRVRHRRAPARGGGASKAR